MKIDNSVRQRIDGIERHDAISNDEKVSRITHIACVACAAVGSQPVPFADIFLLGSTQAYFVSRIAIIRGVPITEVEARSAIKGLVSIVGLGILAEQFAIGVWKVVTLGFGAIFTMALDYAITYAVMKVADAWFLAKARNEPLSDLDIAAIWKAAFTEGRKKGASEKQKIKARKAEGH